MGTGAVIVLIGVILAVLAALAGSVPFRRSTNTGYTDALLCVAVILIGIGVLVGHTQLSNH
jgi:hypothetical protein